MMRKTAMALLLSVGIFFLAGSAAALVDSKATPETQALYAQLSATSGNQIWFGQFYPVKLQSWDDPYGKQSQCYQITQKYPFIFSPIRTATVIPTAPKLTGRMIRWL